MPDGFRVFAVIALFHLIWLSECQEGNAFLLSPHHAASFSVQPSLFRTSSPWPHFAYCASPAQERLSRLNDGKDRTGSFFIAQLSGKQHWMEVGRFYDVYRVAQEPSKQIRLRRILAHETSDGVLMIGRPYLEDIQVNATVLKHFRGPKLYVLKHKPKKWRRFMGHRQEMSRIRIDSLRLSKPDNQLATQGYSVKKPALDVLLARIQGKTKALEGLQRMLAVAHTLAPIEEISLLPKDPLENYDPVLNEKLIESLVLGRTALLPETGSS